MTIHVFAFHYIMFYFKYIGFEKKKHENRDVKSVPSAFEISIRAIWCCYAVKPIMLRLTKRFSQHCTYVLFSLIIIQALNDTYVR